MTKVLFALYGVAAYLFAVATLLYMIAFLGGLPVPRTVDAGPAAPAAWAAFVDTLLVVAFGLQHSVMARGSFKRVWTRVVSPTIERSTYVLAASLALVAMMAFWRPIAQPVVWNLDGPWAALAVDALFWTGWALLLGSTFLLDHFELFGLSQVAQPLLGRPADAPRFRTPMLYRYVRHPLYLGVLLGIWATPRMTAGHLLFSVAASGYILVGICFEERDLVAAFGERYREYQRKVGMLFPWRRA